MNRPVRWRRWPLSLRLLAAIFAAQILLIIPGSLAFEALTGVPAAVIEYAATAPDFAASLRRDADGRLSLEPNRALRRAMADNPGLRIGAVDPERNEAAPGSDPRLTALFAYLKSSGFSLLSFDSEEADIPGGPVASVYYATAAQPRHVLRGLSRLALQALPQQAVIALLLSAISAAVVRVTFRPLREAARSIEDLTLKNLEGRIAQEAAAPMELRRFARSVDAMLDRLSSDVGAHRRFVANAAHELRTPVSVIGARLELLPASPARAELLGDVERLATMIGQLVALSRYEDGTHPAAEPLRLEHLARDVAAQLAPVAVSRGRSLSLAVREPPIAVRGNAAALAGALSNVIDNALHAEPVGGVVEVVVGPGAVIAVRDHGPGIAEADRELAFEPFWRGSAARPGSGLGLAIVRAAMTLHGGAARIAATPGGGATLILTMRGAEGGEG